MLRNIYKVQFLKILLDGSSPQSFPANSSSEVSRRPVFLAIAAFWPRFAGATNCRLSTMKGGGGAVGLTY